MQVAQSEALVVRVPGDPTRLGFAIDDEDRMSEAGQVSGSAETRRTGADHEDLGGAHGSSPVSSATLRPDRSASSARTAAPQ